MDDAEYLHVVVRVLAMVVRAYIAINVEPGKTSHVFSELRKIPECTIISVTAGEWDLLVRVVVDSLEDLYNVTEKIHSIDGVVRTMTLVVEKEVVKAEM